MTTKKLEQYRKLQKESRHLSKRIEHMQNNFTHDVAKGSRTRLPFDMRIVPVTGPSGKNKDTYNQVYNTLNERMSSITNSIAEIEEFINSIADSNLRQIIEYRYGQGLSWRTTAMRVYDEPCCDRVRKAVDRYLKKIQKNL